MTLRGVGTRRFACVYPVGDVPPMIGIDLGRIDTYGLDPVDMAKDSLDLRPAFDLQQDFAAWTDEGQRLIGLARRNRAQDVEARNDRAVVVRRPADERKHRAGMEEYNTPVAIEDLLTSRMAESDPVFGLAFHPGQVRAGQIALMVLDRAEVRQVGKACILTTSVD